MVADLSGPASTLVLAFGGIAGGLDGMPPFEFLQVLLEGTPVKRVFLRDIDQCWYQRGVRGVATDPADVALKLRALVSDTGAQRVVTVGTSAGGFAALLFGGMLGVDRAVAFGPQSFLTRRLRVLHRDHRWADQIAAMRRHGLPRGAPLDLRPMLRQWSSQGTRTVFDVHYGRHVRLDRVHAERLRASAVRIRAHDAGHNVAKALRDRGELGVILAEATEGSGP